MPDRKAFPLREGEQLEQRHAEFPITRRRVTPEESAERGYKKEDEDGRMLFEVAISSEAEIPRWFGIEVLSHAKGAVDLARMNNGAAVLVDHRGDQVGKVMNGTARVDADKVQRGWLRFSRSARGRELEQDVDDETRQHISVGYRILDWEHELRETGKDEKGKPVYTDIFRATQWQPMEVSIVSVPADLTVGVGRSATEPVAAPVEPEADKATKEKRTMADEPKDKPDGGGAVLMTDQRSDTEKRRDEDRAKIYEMCDGYGRAGLAPGFIRQGLSADQVARELYELIRTPPPERAGAAPELPLRESDRKRFSYARAVQIALSRADNERGEKGAGKFDGLEAEVHQQLLRDYGPANHGGILVPYDLRTAEQRWRAMEMQRTLDSKTGAKGPELVFEQAGQFIELLRNRTVVIQLGAQVMPGLNGPLTFPKQTSAGTAFWVGENPGADVTDSDLGLGLVTMQGKTLQGSQSYTRQLLAQSAFDLEGKVRNDLAAIHSRAVDRGSLHGISAAGQPTGIYLTTGVNTKAMGGQPDYVKLVDQMVQVAEDNADEGALGWITTPGMAGVLKTKPEHSTATMASWIWQGNLRDGTIDGYKARATAQISKTMSGTADAGGSEHGIIFGNWNDLVIGIWGAFEIVVDPYTKKKQAIIELTSYQLTDIAVLHPESFAVATGATLS